VRIYQENEETICVLGSADSASSAPAYAQADVAKEAHAASDWEAQASASGLASAYKIGVITGLETSSTGAAGVRIRIDNHTL